MSGVIKSTLAAAFPEDLDHLRAIAIAADERALEGKCSPEIRANFLLTVAEKLFEYRARFGDDNWVLYVKFLATHAFDAQVYERELQNPELCARRDALFAAVGPRLWEHR